MLVYTDPGCCAKGLGDILDEKAACLVPARAHLPALEPRDTHSGDASGAEGRGDRLPHGSQVEIERRSREMRSMGDGKAGVSKGGVINTHAITTSYSYLR